MYPCLTCGSPRFPVWISNGAFIHWSFSIFCPPPTCLSVSFLKPNSSIQTLTKEVENSWSLIPSLRSEIALLRACMTAGLSSWLLVSFWVIWRVSWYRVKMGLYFFTHLSAGWIVWCPLRDVVCHGLTVSWLGRKEKKTATELCLNQPSCVPAESVGEPALSKGFVSDMLREAAVQRRRKSRQDMPCATLAFTPLCGQMDLWSW